MNRIEVTISKVKFSEGIVMVDLEIKDTTLSALLVEVSEVPSWLKEGNRVFAVFKETEVSIAKDFTGKISLRNKFPSEITHIEKGELMSVISMRFHEHIIRSAITSRSVEALELKVGDHITAMVKANELTLMRN